MPTYKSWIDLDAAYNDSGRINWRNGLGRFMKLPEEARLTAFEVAKETAARMKKDAPIANNKTPHMRRLSPVRPRGRLKGNIKSYKTATGGAVDWNSSGTADHWAPIEFGAEGHPISGPNGISFKGHKPPGPRTGDINVPMVNHPGNAPQPYIRPNVRWGEDELWNRVTGIGFSIGRLRNVDFGSQSVRTKALGSTSRGGKKPL
jgi:hypothetical protein